MPIFSNQSGRIPYKSLPKYRKSYIIWFIGLKRWNNWIPYMLCFLFLLFPLLPMNFKRNVVSPPTPPFYAPYGNDYMKQQPKKSVSFLMLFIVIVCTFFVAFLVFKNLDRMGSRFSSSSESIQGQQIWASVSLSGILHANWDLISYTHTLTMIDGSLIGLKSKDINLNSYTGMIEIQWIVEKEIASLFIIEVSAVSWSLSGTWSIQEEVLSWTGMYMSQAGVYFPADFFQRYSLLNQWENGTIKLENIATKQAIEISYFACKKSDPNKNCTQLRQNIWSSAEKTVTTLRGDIIYKLEGITSWFMTNDDLYGYFINDIPDQEVIDIANAVVFPNDDYIQNTWLSKMQSLCTDGKTSLMQVTHHSLGMDLNGLIVNLEWPTVDGSAVCKVFIDLSQAAGWTKISYVTSSPSSDSGSVSVPSIPSSTSSVSSSNIDTSVQQFPINLEKTMTFTSSSRGYSVVFPSMNIAYEAINVDESLDLPGVRCSSQMNLTKFSEKATMHDAPKIKILTCTIKGTLSDLWNSIIQKTSANGIQFLIQIIDPAWYDFANNISVQ